MRGQAGFALAALLLLGGGVAVAATTVTGTSGPDVLAANGNDAPIRVFGYGDDDFLYVGSATQAELLGGSGADTLVADGSCTQPQPAYCTVGSLVTTKTILAYGHDGDDVIQGGAGVDHAGGGSGRDDIALGDAADVQVAYGDDGDDYISGARLQGFGGSGDDVITNTGGSTTMQGGSGDDTIYNDGLGESSLVGGSGDDRITGSPFAEFLDGGSGRDDLNAQDGDDQVQAQDGLRDTVNCGSGTGDSVNADSSDTLISCENQYL